MTVPAAAFVNPPRAGQITNKHGSNTSTDAVPITTRFIGGASESPSGIRFTAQKNVLAGSPLSTPQVMWDTFWVGQPATSNVPSPVSTNPTIGVHSAEVYNGRMYVLISQPNPAPLQFTGPVIIGYIASAAINGANIGGWRMETPVQVTQLDPWGNPYWISDITQSGSMVRIYNFLYVLGRAGIYYSKIQSDGTLSPWNIAVATDSGPGATMAAVQNLQPQDTIGWLVVAYGLITGFAGQPINLFSFNSDGTCQQGVDASTLLGVGFSNVQVGYGALHIDPYGGLVYIGGENFSGTPSNAVYANNNFDAGRLRAGSWSNALGTAALPVALSRFGHAFWYTVPEPSGVPGDSFVYIVGGKNSSGVGVNTIYRANTSFLRANTGGWTAYTTHLNTARRDCGACLTIGNESAEESSPAGTAAQNPSASSPITSVNTGLTYDSGASNNDQGWPRVVIFGGSAPSVEVANAWDTTRPVWSGTAPTITTTNLGGGSSVTVNRDGSVDLVFNFADFSQGGFGRPKIISTLADGDVVQLGVQLCSRTTGEASPFAYTLIKIAQAPSISALAASSTANGLPTLSFTYNPGAGGAPQATWRLTLTRNSDSAVMFDTGIRYDRGNSAAVVCAPTLASGTAYTIGCSVTSADDPMAGASDSASTTLGLTPSLATAPLAPTPVSVTVDKSLGRVLLMFTNPVTGTAPLYNRIYYRQTGDTPWALYADNYTPVARGSVNTLYLADNIKPLIGYDFAVSGVSSTNVEGSKSSTVSATLIPDNGVAFLHQAGKLDGTAVTSAIRAFGDPNIQAEFSQGSAATGAATVPMMGAAVPIRRYGPMNARTAAVNFVAIDDDHYRQLANLINFALLGNPLFYRDRLSMFVVALGDSNKLLYDSGYRKATVELVQVADVYRPFVLQGSAAGVLTLSGGTLPPYDPIEVP